MARYFAEIQGSRGEATRLGTASSGIRGHIRGWDVGVSVYGEPDPSNPDADIFTVYATGGSHDAARHALIGCVKLVDGKPHVMTMEGEA